MLNEQIPYNILVTGGAGFIGSAVIRHLIHDTHHRVINVDKLTYAGNLQSLNCVRGHERYFFEQVDICDATAIQSIFTQYQPDLIMHLAAESHVDRSIDSPLPFIQTNILGTYTLLEQARHYWNALDSIKKATFRFHHVSTDEVYGDLINTSLLFTEESAYAPSSPYSASKASADHLVRAWHRTYGLPILITNCSNNYGPHQFLEKFIPVIITQALKGQKIPIYGRGQQIRDWLYVDDHAHALALVALKGTVGETYNIGSNNERTNLDITLYLCELLELFAPNKPNGIKNYNELISYVADRPGHDLRYAIDASKIKRELNWMPQVSLDEGLKKTIEWYLSVRGHQ